MFTPQSIDPPGQRQSTAVDLGSGDGTESLVLLNAGWRVYSVDSEPAAAQRLASRISPHRAERLSILTMDGADYEVPPADLIWAGLSLFFVQAAALDRLWQRIRAALLPGGRFAGQFLGVNDSWAHEPSITALEERQVREMLIGLDDL